MAKPCPITWCNLQHAGPLPTQIWSVHEATTGTHETTDGTQITVSAQWIERLEGEQANEPHVVIHVDTDLETKVLDHLTPGRARFLAEVMALTGDGDGWLAQALAAAAELLASPSTEVPA